MNTQWKQQHIWNLNLEDRKKLNAFFFNLVKNSFCFHTVLVLTFSWRESTLNNSGKRQLLCFCTQYLFGGFLFFSYTQCFNAALISKNIAIFKNSFKQTADFSNYSYVRVILTLVSIIIRFYESSICFSSCT